MTGSVINHTACRMGPGVKFDVTNPHDQVTAYKSLYVTLTIPGVEVTHQQSLKFKRPD